MGDRGHSGPAEKPNNDEVLCDTLVISLPQRPFRTNKCSHALLHVYIYVRMHLFSAALHWVNVYSSWSFMG